MTPTLPDLSTWHRVPVGATIPAGTPYAYAYEDDVTVQLGGYFDDITVGDNSLYTHYTERPIAPPLPTEEGATIAVSTNARPPHILVTRQGGCWVTRFGIEWSVEITAWAPVTIGETVVMP